MRRGFFGVVLLILLAWAPSASASFPGRNGMLAVVEEGCEVEGPQSIEAYGPGGKHLDTLTDCEINRYGPDWSPRGTRLAFTQETNASTSFWSQKADGTGATPMHISGVGDVFGEETEGPSYSPDGKHVVFAKGESIYTAKTNGTGRKRLFKRPCAECLDISTPRWAPKGGRIAFAAERDGNRGLKDGIWVMSAKNGKHRRRLTKGGFEPDWSPNGKRIVYRSSYSGSSGAGVSGGNLYVVRVKGAKKQIVLHTKTEAATVPVWSPNSKFIAYVGLQFGAGVESFDIDARLMRIRAKGGGRRKLANLADPFVEEGDFRTPDIAWQARR
jgi:Tol biopolymer transport system component